MSWQHVGLALASPDGSASILTRGKGASELLSKRVLMIRVALHEGLVLADDDIVRGMERVAAELGEHAPYVVRFETSIALIDTIASDKLLLDVIIVPYDLPGMTGLHAIQEVREVLPGTSAVMFAATPDHAARAARCGVQEYLVEPVGTDVFERAIRRVFSEVVALHKESLIMATRDGMRRIAYERIVYCETDGHDQVVHLKDGSQVVGRYSSQALFDLLAPDKRFFKSGSSYIVNLDHVAEASSSNGTMTLRNGKVLGVPARIRKSLEAALLG